MPVNTKDIYIHIHKNVYIYTWIHIYMDIHMYTYIYGHIYMDIYIHGYISITYYLIIYIILHNYYFLKMMCQKKKNKLYLDPIGHQFPASEINHLVHRVETGIIGFLPAFIGLFFADSGPNRISPLYSIYKREKKPINVKGP